MLRRRRVLNQKVHRNAIALPPHAARSRAEPQPRRAHRSLTLQQGSLDSSFASTVATQPAVVFSLRKMHGVSPMMCVISRFTRGMAKPPAGVALAPSVLAARAARAGSGVLGYATDAADEVSPPPDACDSFTAARRDVSSMSPRTKRADGFSSWL
jgi:hypothetical protein